MARSIRGSCAVVLTFMAAVEATHASLPPLTYSVSTDTTEIEAALLGGTSAVPGVTLTVEDASYPSLSHIEIWEQLTDGTFSMKSSSAIPDLVAHLPVRVGSSSYDDLFYLAYDGTQATCGLVSGAGGGYDPSGSVIVSYPQGIAPPRGRLLTSSNNMNGSGGADVGVLVTGEQVFVFLDDGAGGLDPSYQTVPLPPGTGADSLAFADVTGDGLVDLLAGSTSNQAITILENTTPGAGPLTFALLQVVSVAGLRAFRVADLDGNGDGFSDVAAIRTSGGAGELLVALNTTGVVPFGPIAIYAVDVDPVALALGDLLPGDGDLDAFVVCREMPTYGTLVELVNDGTGTFGRAGRYLVATPTSRNATSATGFIGVHDSQAGAFTIYPMDPDGLNVSPADEAAAGAGPDPDAGSQILIFRGDGTPVVTATVTPYGSTYGARVGNGNVDGTETLHARDELLTGPGPSPALGPHVRAFRRDELGLLSIDKVSFYAYGTLRNGVSVVGPDFDLDDSDEITTGAGPGTVFGPHVRGFNFDGVGLTAVSKVNFFAYGTLRYGVEVGGGFDGDADDFDEILTGPGPGPTFGAQVRGFDYDGVLLTAMARINFVAMGAPLGYGANVSGGDMDDDGRDEILAGRGAGSNQAAEVAGFRYDGATVSELPGYRTTVFSSMYGVRVNHGDLGGDLVEERDELIVGSGGDPLADATLEIYLYDGTRLLPGPTFPTHTGTSHGANPGGVYLGF